MLDRDLKFDRSKAIERSAHLKDITDRARAATPVNAGRDILSKPEGVGGIKPFRDL